MEPVNMNSFNNITNNDQSPFLNITPSLVFENLIDKIKIIDSDIEFLCENNFLDMFPYPK